jgi:hypothetical protein
VGDGTGPTRVRGTSRKAHPIQVIQMSQGANATERASGRGGTFRHHNNRPSHLATLSPAQSIDFTREGEARYPMVQHLSGHPSFASDWYRPNGAGANPKSEVWVDIVREVLVKPAAQAAPGSAVSRESLAQVRAMSVQGSPRPRAGA